MKLRIHMLAIVCLFFVGIVYFLAQTSPRNFLQLQQYSKQNIELILESDAEVIKAILDSNPEEEFDVDPNTFAQIVLSHSIDVTELTRYKHLKEQYKSLSLTDVIFLNSTLTERIIPVFESLGYSDVDINKLIQSPDFLTAIQTQNNPYLNTLIYYASLTDESIETVMAYAKYEQHYNNHNESDVIHAVNYFNEYLKEDFLTLGYTYDEIEMLQNTYSVEELKYITSSDLTPGVVFDFITTPHFEIEQLLAYCDFLEQNPKKSVQYVIQAIRHPYVLEPSYLIRLPVEGSEQSTVYLNETYRLSPSYRPSNLEALPNELVSLDVQSAIFIQDVLILPLQSLLYEAKEAGYAFFIKQGFMQEHVSDFQTGLTVEISLVNSELADEFTVWLQHQVANYGFILNYVEKQCGEYQLRYVGEEVATEMIAKGMRLEDYVLEHALLD